MPFGEYEDFEDCVKEEQATGIRNDIREEDVDPAEHLKKPDMFDVFEWWNDEINMSQRIHAIDPNLHYGASSFMMAAKKTNQMDKDELVRVIQGYAFRHQHEDVSHLMGFDMNPNKLVPWWNGYNSSMRQHMIDPHQLYPKSLLISKRNIEEQDPEDAFMINVMHMIRRDKDPLKETMEGGVTNEPDPEEVEGNYLQLAKQALDGCYNAHLNEPQDYQKWEAVEDDLMKKALKYLNMAFIAHKEEYGPAVGHEIREDHYMGRNVYPDLIVHINQIYQRMKSEGIPDNEIIRVIRTEFADGSHYWEPWPPKPSGQYDIADRINSNLIPAPSYPPYHGITKSGELTGMDSLVIPSHLDMEEQVAIPSSLSKVSIGANHSGGANRTEDGPADNYTGFGANKEGPPPNIERQDPSYNTRMMPEEMYYPRWRDVSFEGQPNLQTDQVPIIKNIMEIAVPNYARYKYNGHEESEICKSFDGMVFDLNSNDGRPVLPTENTGYTTQHPNCKCNWDFIDPLIADQVEPSSLLGHQKEHLSKINRLIGQKSRYGSLHLINEDGTVSDGTTFYNPRKILETVGELRSQFSWMSPQYENALKSKQLPGKVYLVRAAAETTTDHRVEGEPYKRKLDGMELVKMARTGIGKSADINHNPAWRTDSLVLDGEGDDKRHEIQFVVMVQDPEIIRYINTGQIGAVSINGGSPRNEVIGSCNDGSSDLCSHPQGVILGEQDGIAFTWVVTDPNGIVWHGIPIPSAEPGIKTTKIEPLY